ncbi:MAG: FHA domain-containing protein [Lachnospiraceae bacterium]|nr:FHA domain-containing protein [Lachnospiraceae bacterium]
MRFLTEKPVRGDMRLTELIYSLYDKSLREKDSFDPLLSVLSEYESKESDDTVKEKVRDILLEEECKEEPKTPETRAYEELDDYEDEDDCPEEEDESLFSKLFTKLKGLISKKERHAGEKLKGRFKSLFPSEKESPKALDFLYEETDSIEKPTVLMTGANAQAGGYLLSYEGSGRNRDYPLSKDVFRIGSEKGNDAVLDSPVVSRHHAKIVRQGEDYFIEDLNSKNGTFVNGKMLSYRESVRLKRMDRIIFADEVFRIV